ncbi:MAG: hypothetical protein AAF633_27645 [Chloroflexota bacterium]
MRPTIDPEKRQQFIFLITFMIILASIGLALWGGRSLGPWTRRVTPLEPAGFVEASREPELAAIQSETTLSPPADTAVNVATETTAPAEISPPPATTAPESTATPLPTDGPAVETDTAETTETETEGQGDVQTEAAQSDIETPTANQTVASTAGSDEEADEDPAEAAEAEEEAEETPTSASASAASGSSGITGQRAVYISNLNGTFDLYVGSFDENELADQEAVLTSSVDLFYPKLEPNGDFLTYHAPVAASNWEIYLVDLTLPLSDRFSLNLSNSEGQDSFARWAPDGSQVVFQSNRNNAQFDLYITSKDGTDVAQLTDSTFDELGPSWSPDGELIAFHRKLSEPVHEIFVINLSTGV